MIAIDTIQPGDSDELILKLRESDKDEIKALSMGGPEAVIKQSVARSDFGYSARDEDGNLLCLFGVARLSELGDAGVIWLLGTDKLNENAKELVKQSRRMVQWMLKHHFTCLTNIVWVNNKASIKYLKAVGFKFSEAKRSFTGAEYFKFTRMREEHV